MVVASPPWYYRDAGEPHNMVENPQLYVDFNIEVLRLIKKPLHDTGVVFWHIGDKNELGIPNMIAEAVIRDGWLLQDTIELVGVDECILVLTKQDDYGWNEMNYGNKWNIPIECAGIYMCRNCNKFYDHKNIGEVFVGGFAPLVLRPCSCGSHRFWGHLAAFSEELPKRCIELGSRQWKDTVLDPFAGSGTTGVVGRRLRRKIILIDNNEDNLEMARARIKQTEYEMDCERYGR